MSKNTCYQSKFARDENIKNSDKSLKMAFDWAFMHFEHCILHTYTKHELDFITIIKSDTSTVDIIKINEYTTNLLKTLFRQNQYSNR